MFERDGKQFRNLQEQVLKNKEDIARHYAIDRALSNFGIKIVGKVESESQLPNPTEYSGTYGDAYAVNAADWTEESPEYNYYIFTRPDPNSGQLTDYWLNVGKLGIVGPQGPQGEQGVAGAPGNSTRWYFGDQVPTVDAQPGDVYLVDTGLGFGNIYGYTGNTWRLLGNIKGPQGPQGLQGQRGPQGVQGPQGPQGVQGPSGQSFHIEGIISSTNLLPTPTQSIRAGAYLVGESAPYDMYVIIGGHNEGDLLRWADVGSITSVPGVEGPQGPQGIAGNNGFSIYRTTATSKLNNTVPISSIVNPDGRQLMVGDLILFKTVIHVITAINANNTVTLSTTGTNLQGEKGEQGEPGKVEYEVFSISSVYQPDFGIYINLPTIYKEVEVLSIMISPPSGKYKHYYWNSQGTTKKVIQNGSYIGGDFLMIKGSDGTSVGTITCSKLNTNGVLNADGSEGMITIGLKVKNAWTGDSLSTGQPTGIILVKCVRL